MRREKNLLFFENDLKKLVNVKLYGKIFFSSFKYQFISKKNMEKIGENQIKNSLFGKE